MKRALLLDGVYFSAAKAMDWILNVLGSRSKFVRRMFVGISYIYGKYEKRIKSFVDNALEDFFDHVFLFVKAFIDKYDTKKTIEV